MAVTAMEKEKLDLRKQDRTDIKNFGMR